MTNDNYFNTFGGTALGLRIVDEICNQIQTVSTPAYDIIPVEKLLQRSFKDLKIKNTLNKNVLFKFSGLNEDFSMKAARGVNSSRNNPVFEVNEENFNALIFNNKDLMFKSEDFKAIILQEFITKGSFFISQSSSKTISLEIFYNQKKVVLISENNRNVLETTGAPEFLNDFNKEFDVNKIIHLQKEITRFTSFETNLEGFITKGCELILVQLRKTPQDIFFSNKKFSKRDNEYTTYMTFGIFDVEGEIMDLNDERIYDCVSPVILVQENTIPWNNVRIQNLMLEKKVVFLYSFTGFKFAHSPNDIPPYGDLRNNFNYLYLNSSFSKSIIGGFCKIEGDGNCACLNWIVYQS